MKMHIFNDLEGVRIAAEMEARGETFYRNAARVSKSEETVSLLNSLADDEVTHMREFNRLHEQVCSYYKSIGKQCINYSSETNAYLSAIAADIVFADGLMALRHDGFENPQAILKEAIASEKDSILFYTELAAVASSEHARDVFQEIIRQERRHMARLQNMLLDFE